MNESPEERGHSEGSAAPPGEPGERTSTGFDEDDGATASPAAPDAAVAPAAEALYIVRESSTLEEFDERLEARGIKLKEGHGG